MKIDIIKKAQEQFFISDSDLKIIFTKALAGGEVSSEDEIVEWLTERFIPNIVLISKDEYAHMCVDALKIVSHVAPTDYGSSRQRDMGQLWADMIRGYLGEAAFLQFLKTNWGIDADLGHDKGTLGEYLPMDIHEVTLPGERSRSPRIKISIKATKCNGIWLDIPGDQFNHSDVHVLVKVGVGRDHLFAFFKEISVFKDKVLKIGEEVGSLSKEESEDLFESLPSFQQIPAYICGFALKSNSYENLSYTGKRGRKHYTIKGWNGPICAGDLDKIKSTEGIIGEAKFEGIGEFSHEQGYLFNTGNFLWRKEDWEKIIKNL